MTDKKQEIVSLPLHSYDMEDLLEVLDFANRAAILLAHSELQKGTGITGAAKMNRLARNAKELSVLVSKHVNIGEPESGEVH